VADQELAPQLAEIGVILLMFGVGLHFSVKDLLAVRKIAIPGAVVQILAATAMGVGLAHLLGWTLGAGIVFGLALSVASTVVLLRALQERRLIETDRGRIAVGWLIVEDLAMVLALVLLPALSGILGGEAPPPGPGRRRRRLRHHHRQGRGLRRADADRRPPGDPLDPAPHRPHRLARAVPPGGAGHCPGSRVRLGGAVRRVVRPGRVLRRHDHGRERAVQQAANETLPLRDAFAVLFFVSIGMLFNWSVVLREPLAVLATLAIIVIGKSLAAWLIVIAFKRPQSVALTISASLAQIGEFSFILASLGVSLKLLPKDGQDLILAGAILSILINPLLFAVLDKILPKLVGRAGEPVAPAIAAQPHGVLVGYGRVGKSVAEGLKGRMPLVVIEDEGERADELRAGGFEVIQGNAVRPEVLLQAGLAEATHLFVAVPSPFEAARIIEQARAANAKVKIIARAYTDNDVDLLTQMGATHALIGEQEIARGMLALAPRKAPPPASAH
jgi:CPA2 family monovalent cation:H+ antiporter-2